MGEMADEFCKLHKRKLRPRVFCNHPKLLRSLLSRVQKLSLTILKTAHWRPTLAGTALRIIIKNMNAHSVTIPELGMEDWTPPNLHTGTTSQH